MAYSFFPEVEASIELPEYIDFIKSNIDPFDHESLIHATDMTKKLYNNKNFLVDFINNELKNLNSSQSKNDYTSTTLILWREKEFFLRVNFWLSLSNRFDLLKLDRSMIYEKPHCHNFNFLTIGLFGSGYETEIYEYNNKTVKGIVGEGVELNFLERTKLTPGKVMVYRAGRDVHTQIHPVDFSASFNLMGVPRGGVEKMTQYFFDTSQKKISGIVNFCPRSFLIKVASCLKDENTVDILTDISIKHFCPRTRLAALTSLCEIDLKNKFMHVENIKKDISPFVNYYGLQNTAVAKA